MTKALQFWFEYGSTYSYPAAMRVEAESRRFNVAIEWNVFLLGPLFRDQQALSDSPFNAVPVKGRYMWRDLERICDASDLPWRRPSVFPRTSLLASRVTMALPVQFSANFAKSVFAANFAEDRDISDPEVISDLLRAFSVAPDDVFARAQGSEVKSALRAQTERAAELGIFGAPFFIATDGEMFWGNDRMHDALAWQAKLRV